MKPKNALKHRAKIYRYKKESVNFFLNPKASNIERYTLDELDTSRKNVEALLEQEPSVR